MNLRKTLLATSITSLLCISYGVSAEPVTSVITSDNGVTRVFNFADQANATAVTDAAAVPSYQRTTEQKALVDGFSGQFDGADGSRMGGSTGTVTSNILASLNNVPVTLIKTPGAVVIGQPAADGTTTYLTVGGKAGQTLANGSPATASNIADAYIKQISDPNATPDPLVADAVVKGITSAEQLAVIKTAIDTVKNAKVDTTVVAVAGSTIKEDPTKSATAALIAQQALVDKLTSDASKLTVADKLEKAQDLVAPGALKTVTASDTVKIANLQAQNAAISKLVSGSGIPVTLDTATITALNNTLNTNNEEIKNAGGTPTTPPDSTLVDLTTASTALTNSSASLATFVKAQIAKDGMIQTKDLIGYASQIKSDELQKAKDSANKVLASKTTNSNYTNQAKDILTQVAEAAKLNTAEFFAENTPDNGIAGNPSSMMNIMVDGMFAQSSDIGTANNVTLASSSDGGIKRSFSAGVNYNYYNLAGTSVNAINLPLSYSTKFNDRNELILSVPLSYIGQSSKIDSYQIGVGVAYKFKPMNFWTITPAFNYAYRTGSYSNNWLAGVTSPTTGQPLTLTSAQMDNYAALALGDEVSMWGGSISNKWDFAYNGIKISLTNFNGYFENFGGSLANNDTVSSYVLKNGISFSKNMGSYNASTYLTDTEYFDSNVFFEQINEFGLAINPSSMGNLNISVGYLFSLNGGAKGDLDGFKLNLNYQF